MTTLDFVTALFYKVDEQMRAIPKHSEAHLWPSEVVTLGLLHALKGVGKHAFYRWLTRDYRALFPRLPERTRHRWPSSSSRLSGFRSPDRLCHYSCATWGTEPRAVARWSGVLMGLGRLSAVVASPVWGWLADRIRGWLLLLRTVLGFAALHTLSAMATDVWQFAVFRLLIEARGVFTAVAMTLERVMHFKV